MNFKSKTRRGNINIYTVLMLITLVAFGVGVTFMVMMNNKLTAEDQPDANNPSPWFFSDPDVQKEQ